MMKSGWLILFVLISFELFSQQSSIRIDANYDATPWQQVVTDLETRYPIKFYFAPEWVSGLQLTSSAQQLPLPEFLERIFAGTNLNFYLDRDQVVITQEYQIIDDWPSNQNQIVVRNDLEESISTDLAFAGEQEVEQVLSYTVGDPQQRFYQGNAEVFGYVRESNSGAPMVGVSVFTDAGKGTTTDAFGYYLLTLPKGTQPLNFKSVGMKDVTALVTVHSDGQLNMEMTESVVALNEVVVSDTKDNVESVQTGVAKLNIKELKNIPTALGEVDVMKIALTIPGVQTVGEGASGFNVRGGSIDQNLVLLNNTVIYNPNHLFGFFSVFNPDVINHANLYKSGIQAQYGGRVSSVFDVGVRDGNKKKFSVTGGISPITGRITIEGPIKKDTSSFLIGVRSTYSDYILNLLDDPEFSNSSASFSDFIGKVTFQSNSKNTLSASAYHSRDRFRLNSDTVFSYFNTGASIQWRHTFNNKLFGNFSTTFTNYSYDIVSDKNPEVAFDLGYEINQGNLYLDFDLFLNAQHSLKFGAALTAFQLDPGVITPGAGSNVKAVDIPQERGLEGALYIGDEFVASDRLTLYGGLRLSGFGRYGPESVYSYDPLSSKEITTIVDTVGYGDGELINSYTGLEYRFSARYLLNPNLSLKLSVDNTRQNIHLLTNTTAIAPTDVWRLSSPHIKPQIGTQYAAGLYRTFYNNGLEISIEGYYKDIKNLLEYKNGANLIVNEVLETDIINAEGRSYGVEFLARKKLGKLTGWVAYTYSRSEVKTPVVFLEEQINSGEYYPSNFDQPHNVSVISSYQANRRINVSLNATYHTGRPTTLPFAQYELNGNVVPFFTERNQFRIPYYLRFDLAVNLEGNHRVDKLAHGSWSFSVYNLLGRNNAFSVFTEGGPEGIQVYQLAIFSQPIPTITYKFNY
jgi:hypothetical protein